jgi:hypothetical protein
MKTRIATFLFVLGVCFSQITFANEPVPANKAVSKSVAELLRNNIEFPDFARTDDYECCVLIRIIIQEDGKFKVDCVNCKDERLKAHVIEAVEKLVSEEHGYYAGQQVSLKVNFKCLDT